LPAAAWLPTNGAVLLRRTIACLALVGALTTKFANKAPLMRKHVRAIGTAGGLALSYEKINGKIKKELT
jgi:hypothetical protein